MTRNLVIIASLTKGNKEMATFTKTYNVQPNDKQREALTRAFKTLACFFLNEEKVDVEVVVYDFIGGKIKAGLIANNRVIESRLIGVNGGITLL